MKNTDAMETTPKLSSRLKLWGTLGLSAVLALVFWLYTQTQLVIMFADQLWACF